MTKSAGTKSMRGSFASVLVLAAALAGGTIEVPVVPSTAAGGG